MSQLPETPPTDAPTDAPAAAEVPPFDSRQFRTVLGHFPTGVTIVTGIDVGATSPDGTGAPAPLGFTIGSFTSVSLDPPLVGFLPQTDSDTWAAMAPSGAFCVNVLGQHQADLCWTFAKNGNERERFDGVAWSAGPTGSPVIDRAVAWIDCRVEAVYEMGDHYFVLGRVVALDADANDDGLPPVPLVFCKGSLGHFEAD